MDRSLVKELHYIAHMDNLQSIEARGILNHIDAAKLRHVDIAMEEVQDIRAQVVVPGGQRLHQYANLYFHARNPMMYKRKERHRELCVLRISPAVLDLQGTIVTDGNAGSGYTAFYASPAGLQYLDSELVFARSWNDADEIVKWRRKAARCAEVLVPRRLPSSFITGVYVSGDDAKHNYAARQVPWVPTINADLFFR